MSGSEMPLNVEHAAIKDGAWLTASDMASKRLQEELQFLRQNGGTDTRVRAILVQAADLYKAEDYQQGAEVALKALDIDGRVAVGWNILGLCLERLHQNARAISCFEKVLQIEPDNTDVLLNLGLLAARLDLQDTAEQFLRMYCASAPDNADGINNLATVLRDKGQYDEAIDILKAALFLNPDSAMLWNSMGTVMNDMADVDNALTFFGEAIRIDPGFARAHYNRGNILIFTGPIDQAVVDFDHALACSAPEEDRVHMRFAKGQSMLASGRLDIGWQAYDARLDTRYPGAPRFAMPKPKWEHGSGLKGKRILLVGEQGLGDEILFMNAGHDLIEAVGSEGKVFIACEKRLVPLFQRSFPGAVVGPHLTISDNGKPVRLVPFMATKVSEYDVWAPMASVLSELRPSLESFGSEAAFLKADPERVAYWREQLAALGKGPYIGLTWKSMKAEARRNRFYMPLPEWGPVVSHPDATYISLQYGDASADIAEFKKLHGVELKTLNGIDLREDLDDLAALSCALDLIIGPMNATTNIAMACGTKALIMSSSAVAWPLLGTKNRLPWYPAAESIAPERAGDWASVAATVGQRVSSFCGAGLIAKSA